MSKGLRGVRAGSVFLPALHFASVIGPAVCRLPGGGVQVTPGVPPGGVALFLFLLGQLLIRDKFFHNVLLTTGSIDIQNISGNRFPDTVPFFCGWLCWHAASALSGAGNHWDIGHRFPPAARFRPLWPSGHGRRWRYIAG